ALVVGGHEVVEWIAFELLDAQGNAFLVGVDTQNNGFDLFAFLEVAYSFFAGLGPGKIGQVNQTIDTARQAHKHAEVGNGLDGALYLVATGEVYGELFPGICAALLHAQCNTATIFVDVESHDFDFFTQRDHLAGIDIFVGPVHFGDVHQTFDAVLDLDKRAVISQVGDLAKQAGGLRVTT